MEDLGTGRRCYKVSTEIPSVLYLSSEFSEETYFNHLFNGLYFSHHIQTEFDKTFVRLIGVQF